MKTLNNHFGKIKRTGIKSVWTQDIYHTLLSASWPNFFIVYSFLFILFNSFFALLYYIIPNTLNGTNGSYWQAFSFSVQTFSTIGYGVYSPNTDLAHLIVIIQTILSVFITALLTGLIFSKFSKPSAKVVFSDKILINNFNNQRVLMLRLGNLRNNQIAEAEVKIIALVSMTTIEGQTIRRQVDLPLTRSQSLFFGLTWTVMHNIDTSSPIYNLSVEEIKNKNIEFGVSVTGLDTTFSQTVHANAIYTPDDIVLDKYFEDILTISEKKVVGINYVNFNKLKNVSN